MSGLAVKIKKVKIQNFKSIQDLSIRLNDGLNILIGDNGAGKSNFLEVIDSIFLDILRIKYGSALPPLLYELDVEYNYRGDIYLLQLSSSEQEFRNGTERRRVLKFSKYKNGKSIYKNIETVLPLSKSHNVTVDQLVAEVEKLGLAEYGLDFIKFNVPDEIDYITSPGKFIIRNETATVTEENAGYTSSLFMFLQLEVEKKLGGIQVQKLQPDKLKQTLFQLFEEKKRRSKYAALLKRYTPISDLRLNENINVYTTGNSTIIDNFVLNFKVNGDWLPWSFLSDGTKRLFHIVTEIVLANNDVILIEEPELGIHPSQLYLLLEFLKLQAQRKQILFSTHSPVALDILDANELDSIIITKLTNRGTKMYHLNEVQLSKANAYIKKVGKLSDYWLHSDLEK